MKKFVLSSIILLIFSIQGITQVTFYSFNQSVLTYTSITGGTVLIDGTSAMDSWVSGAITIPSFTFNGVAYTTAYVTSNGQLSLGGSAPSSTTYTGISTGVGSGINICPFSADLDRGTTTTSTEIRWQTVGNEVIFQWQQMKRYLQTESFDFQVRLNTVTGVVNMVYQLNSGPGSGTSYQPEVGIRTSATDYNNRLVASGTEDWATSLQGTANSNTCRFTSTAPAKSFVTGLTYTYTPPAPCTAPSAQPTALILTPGALIMDGSFTAASGANTYLVIRSISATLSATPANGTVYTAGSSFGGGIVDYFGTNTTFTSTGLTPSTPYYYFVFSTNHFGCTGGPLYLTTSPLTGSQTTLSSLTGTKTIDPFGSGPDNYVSFTLAINDLNARSVGTGGVIFNVASGNTFTEDPPVITATGSALNPIVFQKSGVASNPVISATGGSGANDAGIVISGGDYFTFDGVDISVTGALVENGYLIRNASATDGAMYNTIKNCKITLNRTNTSSKGILQTASATYGGGISPSANSGANSFNKYYNVTIENSYSGIWLYSSSTYFDSGNEIGITGSGSTTIGAATANDIGFGTSTVYGIYSYYQNNVKIFNTEIRNLTGTSSNTIYGLYSYYNQGTCLIYNNKIHDLSSTYTTSGSYQYGMYIYYPSSVVSVYNNILYNFSYPLAAANATTYVYGIYLSGSTTCNVLFNTVRMNLSANVSNSAFYNAMTTCNVANNIFSNFSTAGATSKRYCFYASTAPVTSSNNLYYIDGAGTNNFVGYRTSDRTSLELFASAISATAPVIGLEGGSGNFDPNFTSATDLTFAGATPARYSGIPIAGITTDINGTTRDAARPTIGAYETTQTLIDKSAPVFSNLTKTNGLSPVVSIVLTDNSNSLNNATLRLWYRLQGSTGAYTALDADVKPAGAMNGTYTWNTSLAALPAGIYQFYIAGRDDQGAGTGIWAYPMWATTFLGWAAGDPPNFTANPDAAANVNTFTKQAFLAGGTYEVGTDQPVLKKLTDVKNQLTTSILTGNVIYELNSTYDGTTGETFPIVFNQYAMSGGNWTVIIRVKTGAGARTISGTSTTSLISLDGVTYLTFDGREGGTGSTKSLSFLNTSTSGTTIQFINDARFNTFKYCQIRGVETSTTLGVITFSTTTGFLGNSNNLIDYCDIYDGATTPANLIYSSGTAAAPNSFNTVSNSNLYNWFLASTTSQTAAINVLTGNSDWTVTGNSFYQTASRTYTSSGIVSIVNLANTTTGLNFVVTNNYFGGTLPLCGGTPMTLTATTGTPVYRLVSVSGANGTTSVIQGNTLANIALTSAQVGFTSLIYHAGGHINILNNTIGSQTATGSVTYTNSATSTTAATWCILQTGSGSALVNINITGNTLGGLSASVSSTGLMGMRVVYAQPVVGSAITIDNNFIGGTIANSITQNANGILSAMMILNPTIGNIITNNTIRNLTHNNTGATGSITGINTQSSGGHTIMGNTIYNLTTNSTNVAINNAASIVGITMTASGTPGTNVSQNTIYNLVNTNTTVAGCINGMYFGTPNIGQTTISRNFVHSFSTASATSIQTGIFVPNTGIAMVYNNMVRLGIDAAGASQTNSVQINGIWKASSGNVGMYFNSVYIGGSGVVSGAVNTYAFRTSMSGGIDTTMNNIFVNNRSNTSGTGKHYGIFTAASTNMVCNYNLYQTTGTGGVFGINNVTDYATIAAWRGGTNLDNASGYGNPNFILPTGTGTTVDLHVQSPTAIEAAGSPLAAITTDYDGAARAGLTPVDIGADAGLFTSSGDIFPPNILYTPLTNGTTANRVVSNFATITDNVGVSGGASLPRIYYKKSTDANAFVGNTSANNGWKYAVASNATSPYSFTIDYSIINGGSVANGDIIQYFVVAQDAANNLGSNFGGAGASGNPPVQNVNAAPAAPLQYTIAGALPSTITVGTSGTYPSLTGVGGAFAAINAGTLTGNLIVQVLSDLTEDGTNALNPISEDPPGSNFTITIQPSGATENLISGAVANGMIRLNGAARVTFDGRSGGSGRYLRFRNTNTSNPTFTFVNDATGNTIRNCYIEGANTTTTSGVILFSTTTGTLGNDNNLIASNIIRDRSDVAGIPYNLVYSSGTAGRENSGLTFSDNEFSNFSNYGVNLTATGNGDGMVFTNNSIYQEAPRASNLYGIYIGAGNGHTLTGNSFGGSNASRTGAALQTTGTTGQIYGIYLATANSTPTSVQGNIMSNFGSTGTGSTTGVFGLYILTGNVNVGTITGNTFGGGALPSDTIRNGYDNGIIYSASAWSVNIENNLIGNVAYYNAGGDRTAGIYIGGGTVRIKNNIIRDIESNSTSTGTSFLPVGIVLATTLPATIEGNTIYNITNTNTGTSAYTAAGIVTSGNWTNSTILGNNIYNVGAMGLGTGTSAPQVYGIYLTAGNASYYNNLVAIGQGTAGESRIYGIWDASTGFNTYYYNSVNIFGTGSGGNATYGFLKSSSSIVTLNNNILTNARTGGTIKPYAIGATTNTGFTSNYNDLYSSGAPLGVWGATDQANLAAWQLASAGDAASKSIDPNFLSDTDLRTCEADLNGAGIAVPGITTDFTGATRGNPPDIGAYEFSYPVPTITGPTPVCAASTGNRYTTEGGMTGYTWSISPGGILTSPGNSSEVTVTWVTPGAQWISVNYANANGCQAETPTIKNITVNAQPIPTLAGPNAVCLPASGSVYTTEGGMSNYTWTVSAGGTITSGGTPTSSTVTVLWNSDGAQSVSVNYTDANGCSASTASQYNVTVFPVLSVGSISADQIICYNTVPAVLTGVAPTGGNTPYSYQWQSSTDNVTFMDIPGAMGLNYSPGALTQTTYFRSKQTSANGCGTVITNTVTITVYPNLIPGFIFASHTICYNTPPVQLIGFAPTGGNPPYSYQWQSSTDNSTFSDIPGATTLFYQGPSLTQTTYYRLNQTSSSECGTVPTNTVTVTVLPEFVAGSISANQSICANTAPALLTGIDPTGGGTPYTYQWQSSTDNLIFTNISGATNLNYQPGILTRTTYYKQAQTSASSCGTVITNVVTITVNPAPAAIAGADRAICLGESTTLGAVPVTGNTYAWTSVPAGFTSTTSNPTVSPVVTTTYTLVETITATGCTNSNSVLVTVNPLPDAEAGADRSICSGQSTQLGAAAVAGNTYSWTSVPAGFTSAVSNPTVSPLVTTTYTLVETVSATGCTNSHSVVVTVDPLPAAVAGADRAICEGESTQLGTSAVAGNTYSWTSVPAGFTSAVADPTVSPLVTTTYTLVETITATGCTNSNSVVVTVNPLPAAIAGADRTICEGQSTQLGASAVAGNTYSWTSVPAGFTSALANPTVSPMVNTTYTLVETVTATGCTNSHSVAVTVDPLPAAAGTITGSSSVVQGQTGVAYTVPAITNATGYAWTLPAGASITSGGNTNSIVVSFSASASSGVFSVYGTNLCGNGATSPDFAVTVTTAVPTNLTVAETVHVGEVKCYNALQTITVAGSGNTFTVETGGDATFIAGQNIRFLPGTTVQPGGHLWAYITTTGSYCGTLAPSIVTVSTPEITPPQTDPVFFKVYPNPTSGKFTLELTDVDKESEVFVEIYTMRGETKQRVKLIGEKQHEFTLEGNPSGVYIMRILNKEMAGTAKIIKN